MILLRAVGLGAGHPDSFPHVILQVSRNVVAAAVAVVAVVVAANVVVVFVNVVAMLVFTYLFYKSIQN